MPMEWCDQPVAHPNTTKLGCRPRDPRGNRRPHNELARYVSEVCQMIDEMGHFLIGCRLCRTCYGKEYLKFNAAKLQHQNIELDISEMMDVVDASAENRFQINATMNDLSIADYQINENFELSTSESFTGSDEC